MYLPVAKSNIELKSQSRETKSEALPWIEHSSDEVSLNIPYVNKIRAQIILAEASCHYHSTVSFSVISVTHGQPQLLFMGFHVPTWIAFCCKYV